MVSHAILGATLAYVNGGNPAAGGTATVASEAAATYFTNQYKDDPRYQNEKGEFVSNLLPEDVKTQIRDLTAAIGAVAGGTFGDSAFNAQLAGVVGQNAVENNELYSKRETKNGTEFYYDQDDIEFNLLQYQVAKGLLSRDEVPNSIFEKLDGTLSLDTGGTTIQNPSKESFSIQFDREIAANSVITDEEYNKLISENPQIVAKIQAETGLDFSASQSNDYVGKIEDIESNSSIADGARAVQSFMDDRVTDITDVRDNGDSGWMVTGAAVSTPFMRMLQGAVNGGAGLVILGTDADARAQTWSDIKIFAEHPIDNTSTALTNY